MAFLISSVYLGLAVSFTPSRKARFPSPQTRGSFLPFASLSEWLHLGALDRDIQSSPRRKLGRLPACYFVRERNSVGRIRTQVGMSFPVTEHLCQLGGPREKSSEHFLWHLFD